MSPDGTAKWISRGNRRELCRTGVMTMVSETFECVRTGATHDFITMDLIDWVVVIPETPEKELLMIRQFRHGTQKIELEVPGGCIDRADASPLEAAERELLEETGFAGENPHIIGKVCPNPAIQHKRDAPILLLVVFIKGEADVFTVSPRVYPVSIQSTGILQFHCTGGDRFA